MFAFLSALAFAACQTDYASPTSPGAGGALSAAGARGGGGGGGGKTDPDPVSFAYTHTGDIMTSHQLGYDGSDVPDDVAAGQDRKGGGLNMDDCCGTFREDIVLSGTFLGQIDPTGACFGGGSYQTNFVGSIVPSGADVVATYYFTALDLTGGNETKYRLDVTGSVIGNFLPGAGEISTVTFSSADMNTEGKGKGKNGCTGSGLPISGTVEIEHKACEPIDWVPNGGECPAL